MFLWFLKIVVVAFTFPWNVGDILPLVSFTTAFSDQAIENRSSSSSPNSTQDKCQTEQDSKKQQAQDTPFSTNPRSN